MPGEILHREGRYFVFVRAREDGRVVLVSVREAGGKRHRADVGLREGESVWALPHAEPVFECDRRVVAVSGLMQSAHSVVHPAILARVLASFAAEGARQRAEGMMDVGAHSSIDATGTFDGGALVSASRSRPAVLAALKQNLPERDKHGNIFFERGKSAFPVSTKSNRGAI